ncbi:hypothetical protein ABR737_43655 [Streptomyces sp. Edi2]|uniref:hypothetical protein n=1 Tax=Streptomyces sp. Edi2 TaxID=3162528 RepID=UPI00330667DF
MPTVYMTAEHMTPEAFVDLAATAGARLLYSCRETFDLASLDLEEDEEQSLDVHTRNRIAAVRHQATTHQGRCRDVHLAFAADGVLHCWTAVQAAWYTAISAEFEGALAVHDEDVDNRDRTTADEPDRMSEREIALLAAQLRESPEFREAPSQAQRQRIVRRLVGPRVANYWAVVERAADAVDAASEKAFAELEAQLEDLAEELANDSKIREARSKARKVRAVAFLKTRSGGYKPPSGLVEILLDEVAKKIRNGKP